MGQKKFYVFSFCFSGRFLDLVLIWTSSVGVFLSIFGFDVLVKKKKNSNICVYTDSCYMPETDVIYPFYPNFKK